MSSPSGLYALAAAAAGDLEMEKNLEDIVGDVDDLAAPDKETNKIELLKTFKFGLSSMTTEDLDESAGLGWFARNLVRHSEGKVIPKPNANEALVFRDFFLVGLQIPVSKFVGALMEKYDTYLHHQTPNSIMTIVKFIWFCRTFGEYPDIDCFGSFYELHNQGP